MSKKYKLHIDSEGFANKPSQKDSAGITTRMAKLKPVAVTAKEVAEALAKGQSFTPSVFRGGRSQSNFIEAHAFALDFDNEYPKGHELGGQKLPHKGNELEDGLYYMGEAEIKQDDFIQKYASFYYMSFSHKPEHEKFRVVFFFDKPLRRKETEQVIAYLGDKFPQVDKKTLEISRLFYGGKESHEINYENELPVGEIVGKTSHSSKVETIELFDLGIVEKKAPVKKTYQLIRAGEKEEVKLRLAGIANGKKFATRNSAKQFFIEVNMGDILGLPVNQNIHALFRNDSNPSARIYKPDGATTWLYKDFGDNTERSLNIVQVIQKLLAVEGRDISQTKAIEYLLDVTDSEVQMTAELKEIHEQIELFRGMLLSDTLKEQHPEVYQIFGRYNYSRTVMEIIDIFKMKTYEDENGVICLSWISADNLAKRLNVSPFKTKQLLKLLTLTRVLDVLDDDMIPEKVLELIKRNQTHWYDEKKNIWVERNKPQEYRSNVYRMSLFEGEDQSFGGFEERCVMLADKGFSMRGLSKEWVERTLGKEEADKAYPQDKERKISKVSNDFASDVAMVAMEEIKLHGFITVNHLKEVMQQKWMGKTFTEFKYKQCEQELIESYGLNKKRLNSALKEKFGVTSLFSPKQSPAILLFED